MQTICGTKLCKANDFITSERLEMLDHVVKSIYHLISNSAMLQGID